MGYFSVIDTETNWADQVMSIGTVIADEDTFQPVAAKYHILPEECAVGGMFYDTLFLDTPVKPILCTREEAMADLSRWLCRYDVTSLFAYNAGFDRNHLPELRYFDWYDIMRIAIYRQHNPKIPACADCYSTGRMKRGYGVESMHLLLKEEQTAAYTVEIWKRFRKWGGIPTGITQNVKDLLSSREVENIFENSDFVYMLNQAGGDRQILAKQLGISPHQLSYVTHSSEGEGLLFYGSTILPFVDHFPKNTELYRIMTTKPQELKKEDE